MALACGLAACALGCGDDPAEYLIDLGGEHRFRVGDQPDFASPELDDASWRTVTLPATWRVWTMNTRVIGWHRLHFEATAEIASRRLALDLGAIGWSDEAFLNGRRIGGTGWFDRMPRLGQRPRLYSVPEGLVRAGPNLLAIRVCGIPHSANGLFATRIGLGDETALMRARATWASRNVLAEGFLLGFLGFGWLLAALFPRRGRAGRATLFLLGSLTLQFGALWLVGGAVRAAGWSPDVSAPVPFGVLLLSGCCHLAFVATLTRGRLPLAVRGVVLAGVLISLLLFSWPSAFPPLLVGLFAVVIAIGVISTVLLVAAFRARVAGVLPLAVGDAVVGLSAVAMTALRSPFVLGVPLIYCGLAIAFAGAVFALLQHVRALNRQAQRATEYALQAHTRERGRLARDLHDGLGQMLALLRLQMQRMGKKHAGEPTQSSFDDSAAQVAATLEELRRIARDLRPAPLQDRGFGEAMREYAAAMALRTSLEVVVEGDYKTPPSEDVAAELYRIAQECLTNSFKHSGARRVVVTLGEVGDRHTLSVADDGRGLPTEIPEGLGLSTIRERSELLGGSCSIIAPPTGGTRVEVSVPRSS